MSILFGIGIGFAAGILGGMMGIGGGIIMVPGMVLLLGVPQHTAQGVSLAVIVATAVVGTITHYRQNNVKLDVALWVAPSAALFGLLGGQLAAMLDATWLARAFGVLLLALGTKMALGK